MPDPKQTLNIAQKQVIQQRLTKQQLIMFELLACTDQSLEQRVTEEVQANPAFDDEAYTAGTQTDNDHDDHDDDYDPKDDDDIDEPQGLSSDEMEDVMQGDDGYYADMDSVRVAGTYEGEQTIQDVDIENAYDYLKGQLRFMNLPEGQLRLCEYLVDCLDDNGYLASDPYDIIDDYFNVNGVDVSLAEVKSAIGIIRTLEPVGVGAADMRDCLLMQLSHLPESDDSKILTKILNDCYKQLVSQGFDYIKSQLAIDDDQLHTALALLNELNPKPLLSMQSNSLTNNIAVIPEFVVSLYDGKLSLSLTGAKLPPLKLSDEYLRMSESKDQKVSVFAQNLIDRANDFIAALEMRQQTMMKIMLAILNRQREFFLTGDDTTLTPMVLQDIADDSGFDQSTVSRVTSNKYVQTPYGVISLKSLFTTSAKSNDGESVSRNKVISLLKEIIDNEDKSNPLSDDQLSDLMEQKGYTVKRRTIAKYRSLLGIGTAQMRKVLK